MSLDCFKAYDTGRIPDQLNEDIARRIGRAYAEVIQPGSVVVGHDIRLTSEAIKAALLKGSASRASRCRTSAVRNRRNLLRHGAFGCGGGIAVTASHNPKDYNGMKFVGRARSRSRAIRVSLISALWRRATLSRPPPPGALSEVPPRTPMSRTYCRTSTSRH